MKCLRICLVLVMFGIAVPSIAQMKIGYVSMEVALLYMPETKTMNQQLDTYQQKLANDLQAKQSYLQAKFEEYNKSKESGSASPVALEAKEKELMQMQNEIQKLANDSDQKLQMKRTELMTPIVEKLQKNLNDMRKEKGYDYILNTVDGSGVSIVLSGPEEHDLTQPLLSRMGIKTE